MSRGSIKPHVAFNMLTANRKANLKADGSFAVHIINKGNGKMRKEPFGDKTFKTKEEAEKQMEYWMSINPGRKFIIRSTNDPLPESGVVNKIDMYLYEGIKKHIGIPCAYCKRTLTSYDIPKLVKKPGSKNKRTYWVHQKCAEHFENK